MMHGRGAVGGVGVAVALVLASACNAAARQRVLTNDVGNVKHALEQCFVVWFLPSEGELPLVFYPDPARCGPSAPISCSRCQHVSWNEARSQALLNAARVRQDQSMSAAAGITVQDPIPPEKLPTFLEAELKRLCAAGEVIPGFDPCDGLILVADRIKGHLRRLTAEGELIPAGPFGNVLAPSQSYIFVDVDMLRDAGVRLGTISQPLALVVDATQRADPFALVEIRATIVHESFHAFFQRVIDGQKAFSEVPFAAGVRVASGAGMRAALEHRFLYDSAFRDKVVDEYCLLLEAARQLRQAEDEAAKRSLRQAWQVRTQRHRTMTPEERNGELFWDFLEGSALFVEYLDRRRAFGVDWFPRGGYCRTALTASYFLDLGAIKFELVRLVQPAGLWKCLQPQAWCDVNALLANILLADETGG